jgi:hypothetical protein
MKKPLRIAIIGSVDRPPEEKAKQQGELPNEEKAADEVAKIAKRKEKATDLGRQLVAKGYHIVVYEDKEHFLEPHVVRGYIEGKKAAKDSIRVYYFQKESSDKIPFSEYEATHNCFDYKKNLDEEWEVSFYNSLTTNDPKDRIDGAIFLGGGRSTLIAGVVMVGYEKLIVAYPEVGSSAEKVLKHLRRRKPFLGEQLDAMEHRSWYPEKLIGLFSEQQKAFKAEEKKRRQDSRKFNEYILRLITLFSTVLAFLSIPFTLNTPPPDYAVLLLFMIFAPAFAGAGGAALIEITKARSQNDNPPSNQQSASQTFVVGFSVGLIYAGFITIQQLAANSVQPDHNIIIQQAQRLILISVPIGFGGGLALDTVIERIRGAVAQRAISLPDQTE